MAVIAAFSLVLAPWALNKSAEYRNRMDQRDDASRVSPGSFKESGNAERVELGAGDPMDAFEAELRNATECVRKNQESEILNGRLAEDAVKICDMEAASIAASRIAS